MAQTMNPYCQIQTQIEESRETTRLFRYDLSQIPYDYTVEVRNRFKGLDMIECLMNYGLRFMKLYRRQGSRPSPWKKKCKKAKWFTLYPCAMSFFQRLCSAPFPPVSCSFPELHPDPQGCLCYLLQREPEDS